MNAGRLADSPPLLLVLCALDFERTVLERSRGERHSGAPQAEIAIEVCGPGRTGIAQWFASRETCPSCHGVLLVGTAGGLDPRLHAGTAFLADRVIDAAGRSWTPTPRFVASTLEEVRAETVLSVESAAASPQEKALHHTNSGAAAVDLESAAFAEHCDARGWPWGVVRGISDGATESLPRDVATWVDQQGRLRTLALLASLVRSPGAIAMLPRLRRQSTAALHAAAAIVARIAASAASTMETAR